MENPAVAKVIQELQNCFALTHVKEEKEQDDAITNHFFVYYHIQAIGRLGLDPEVFFLPFQVLKVPKIGHKYNLLFVVPEAERNSERKLGVNLQSVNIHTCTEADYLNVIQGLSKQ